MEMISKERICRFCGWYRPNERYRGVIGICDVDGKCSSVDNSCDSFVKGEQTWMNGEKVEDGANTKKTSHGIAKSTDS